MDFPIYLSPLKSAIYTVKFSIAVNSILYINIKLLVKEHKNSEIQITLKILFTISCSKISWNFIDDFNHLCSWTDQQTNWDRNI